MSVFRGISRQKRLEMTIPGFCWVKLFGANLYCHSEGLRGIPLNTIMCSSQEVPVNFARKEAILNHLNAYQAAPILLLNNNTKGMERQRNVNRG